MLVTCSNTIIVVVVHEPWSFFYALLASLRHQVYVSLNQKKYNMLCGFFSAFLGDFLAICLSIFLPQRVDGCFHCSCLLMSARTLTGRRSAFMLSHQKFLRLLCIMHRHDRYDDIITPHPHIRYICIRLKVKLNCYSCIIIFLKSKCFIFCT